MRKQISAFAVSALLAPVMLFAQASPKPAPPAGHAGHHPAAKPAATASPAAGDMMAKCRDMMAHHQQMMDDMKAMDTRLDGFVKQMNSAPDDHARVTALVAVVNEMAQQRAQMRDRMMSMHQSMMGHMAEHMAAGGTKMMDCPMMKGMSGGGDRP